MFAITDQTAENIVLAIIGAIPIIAAAIVSIIVAVKTGKKVDEVQADMKNVKIDIQRGMK